MFVSHVEMRVWLRKFVKFVRVSRGSEKIKKARES